jgi:hypothetical protein
MHERTFLDDSLGGAAESFDVHLLEVDDGIARRAAGPCMPSRRIDGAIGDALYLPPP